MSKYGEPWRLEDDSLPLYALNSDGQRVALGVASGDDYAKRNTEAHQRIVRAIECVNAMEGMSARGLQECLRIIAQVVEEARAAKAQGWTDFTNFTTNLELALDACYDTKDTGLQVLPQQAPPEINP